jgi:hypothetical protein
MALAKVFKNLKDTGKTAPNKAIFISHFVMASIFILIEFSWSFW